jgi:hypothetical protein
MITLKNWNAACLLLRAAYKGTIKDETPTSEKEINVDGKFLPLAARRLMGHSRLSRILCAKKQLLRYVTWRRCGRRKTPILGRCISLILRGKVVVSLLIRLA